MRRFFSAVYFIALVALCCVSAWSQVILQDPNTPEAAALDAVEKAVDPAAVDERLNQKITYTAIDKRLGNVLSELSAISGVVIKCGKTKEDWQVQDIPVVVCVRGLELGKLLRSIAESAHLTLTPTTVNGITLYRIWRSSDIEKMMNDYQTALTDYGLASVKRDLDSWQKWGSMSQSDWDEAVNKPNERDSQLRSMGIDPDLHNSCSRSFALLLATADPDIKQKILAGERIKWVVSDLPKPMADHAASIVRNYYLQQREQQEKYAREHPDANISVFEFKDEDIQNARIQVWMSKDSIPSLMSKLTSPRGGRTPVADINSNLVQDRMKDQPIKYPREPKTEYSPNLKIIQSYSSEDTPLLQTKIKIDKPKDRADLKYRDLLVLFSEAVGYSIVCEDFRSHDIYCPLNRLSGVLDCEIAVKDVLVRLTRKQSWYADEDAKLIVSSSLNWYSDHTNLAPASLVDYINIKMNGDGVYLDDMLLLMQLTRGQYNAWFQNSYGMNFPRGIEAFFRDTGNPFWSFIGSLSPEDKELAKSGDGLSLGKFDPQYISGLLQFAVQSLEEERFIPDDRWVDTLETMGQEDMLPRLTMKLVRQEAEPSFTVVEENSDGSFPTRTNYGPQGIPRHRWNILVSAPDVGVRPVGSSTTFPIYSVKREAEIMAERQKSADGDGDKATQSTEEPK